MSIKNIQNYIAPQSVQTSVPVQQISECSSSQYIQGMTPVAQTLADTKYMPRYMPMIKDGQVYPVPIPQNQLHNMQSGKVGTVNIIINGVEMPMQAPPVQQYTPPVMPINVPPSIVNNTPQESKKDAVALPKEPLTAPKSEKTTKKKPVTELTDSYIQQLEKKLNDTDKTLRSHAVAELLSRFKEDETRKDDPSLTSLLNLALQDKSKPIVLAAMQALAHGYANGNTNTLQLLQSIRDSKDSFGNWEIANGVLAKLSAT